MIIITIAVIVIDFVVVVVVVIGNFPIDLIVFLCIAREPLQSAVQCAEVAGEELFGCAATPTSRKVSKT